MNVLNEQLARIKARYLASPLPGFLAWWRDELLSLLPDHWRLRLWPPREQLLITATGSRVKLWRSSGRGGHAEEVLDLDLEHDKEFASDQIKQLLASYEDSLPQVVFCLPKEQVLNRRLTMPAAAESSLGQALAFEMDKHTPFTHQEVYFDYHIVSREKDENLLAIDLYVTIRESMDQLTALLDGTGLGLGAVDINLAEADEAPRISGVNLLPLVRRQVHKSRRAVINWALAGLAVILLAVVMAESLYLQERTILRLEEELEASQQEVRIVRRLRGDLDEAMAAAGFLGERKQEAASLLSVLGEVSELLPQDTWVQRMQITGTELQLQGLSGGAQKLIELMNSASVLEGAYFKGATTTDQRLNKERYTVVANIVMKPENSQESKDAATSGP
ncbi:MAG: pilus assembly protein PilM [Xanthomonadales bacterium]|nr:pilus assembly protein PilM [Xanthomonadales bacterium]